MNILARELKARAYQESKLAALLALLGVLLLPYFHYHRLRSGLLALIPLGIGITRMFGLMDVFGMRLNLVNIFAVILIMGIGVDYGIYVLDRYYESGQCDVSLAVNQTGKAVRMAAPDGDLRIWQRRLFGLSWPHQHGDRLYLGSGSCMIASLILLPAVLFLWGRPSFRGRKDTG